MKTQARRQQKVFTPKAVNYKTKSKSERPTQPDLSMTIKEILTRFQRKLPVMVSQRDPVYMDQNEHDFEALARQDFAEKRALADEMKARAQKLEQDILARREARKKMNDEQRKLRERKEADDSEATGIDPLDNTMPVDTNLRDKPLDGPKKGGGRK